MFDGLRLELVRYPSDLARFDAMVETVSRVHDRTGLFSGGAYPEALGLPIGAERFLWAPLEITAFLLNNPRIDGCFWFLIVD